MTKCQYNDIEINVPEELRDWVKQFVDKDGNLNLEAMDHGSRVDYPRKTTD